MRTVIQFVLGGIIVLLGMLIWMVTTVAGILLRSLPLIIVICFCLWIMGCTTNVTIDNSVIDQSDVTQVLGCATDAVYDLE